MELLGASEAENLTKQKWKQYFEHPVIYNSGIFKKMRMGFQLSQFEFPIFLYVSPLMLSATIKYNYYNLSCQLA